MSKKKKIFVAVFVALAVAGVVAYLIINKQDKPTDSVQPSDERGLEGKMFTPLEIKPATTDEGGESAAAKESVKGNNF